MKGTKIGEILFRNLTPHDIQVHADGVVYTVPASGTVARAETASVALEPIAGIIPVSRNTYGEVQGLPAPENGVVYIVSALTAQAVQGRSDVFVPGQAIRDDAGRVVGCQGLCRL